MKVYTSKEVAQVLGVGADYVCRYLNMNRYYLEKNERYKTITADDMINGF